MEVEIELPSEVPVMTLSGAVLFPQVMMPLHIFEPRYRQMLGDVLETNRLFAVAHLDDRAARDPSRVEPPHPVATVGIVRASHQNNDGTSNLVIQGLVRVKIVEILREEPYRMVRVRPLPRSKALGKLEGDRLRAQVMALLDSRRKLGIEVPEQVLTFLRGLSDAEAFLDLAVYSLSGDDDLKQEILATRHVAERFHRFIGHLVHANREYALMKRLQGRLGDDRISLN